MTDRAPTRHTHAPASTRVDVVKGSYACPELRPFEGRAGAMDAFALPSRVGGGLSYPKGEPNDQDAQPLP